MSEKMIAPKISVIVPVYKVEAYLHRCVDSILAQTYTNLEIILVDDGSPDTCGAICDKYAQRDNRIKVIHKENGGLSDARNAGLVIATGDWLSFIDSDDWIEPTMYDTLLTNALTHKAQISIGGVVDELLTDNGIVVTKTTAGESVVREVRKKTSAIEHFLSHSWSAWDKIYRREVFEGIRYPVGEINEDEAIALHLLDRCERVVYTNEPFYHYIRRPESITTSTFSPKKLAWYRHCKANLEWIRVNYPELEDAAATRYRNSLLWTLTEMALAESDYRKEIKALIGELKANRKLFGRIPYQHSADKIRSALLTHLPFALYKAFIRIKRNH